MFIKTDDNKTQMTLLNIFRLEGCIQERRGYELGLPRRISHPGKQRLVRDIVILYSCLSWPIHRTDSLHFGLVVGLVVISLKELCEFGLIFYVELLEF